MAPGSLFFLGILEILMNSEDIGIMEALASYSSGWAESAG
jgi:hypothetical protein